MRSSLIQMGPRAFGTAVARAAAWSVVAVGICATPAAAAGDGAHQPDIDLSISAAASAKSPPPEPAEYRTDNYRTVVPLTLKGATVLSSAEAMKLWNARSAIFIDVYPHPPKPPNLPAGTLWRETTHHSIEDAVWLPNVGYGVLSAEHDAYFRRSLETLTHGDKAKRLVFFCLRNCWMSWNAAKRALSYGYSNVDWYRDGSDGWQEIGGLIDEVRPLR